MPVAAAAEVALATQQVMAAKQPAGFVAVLQGDAAAAVRALHESTGQPWAAVHVADLLWQAGVSGRKEGSTFGGPRLALTRGQ